MPNKQSITRRATLLGGSAAVSAIFLPSAAFALNKSEAENLIGQLVDDINAIINSGRTGQPMYNEFEKVFRKYGDTPTIARSALGVAWRSASGSQQRQFTKAFEGYMSRKYGKRFKEFVGGQITVTGSKKVKSGFLVTSTVKLRGSSPFIVEWQVSDKSGKTKMFNMYIEGINMLATERAEIGALLDARRGNLNKLITDLKIRG